MILKFHDRPAVVNESLLGTTVSRSTGDELAQYSIKIIIEGIENSDTFKEMLNHYKDNDLLEIDNNDKTVRLFRVGNYRCSYEGKAADDTEFTYKIEIHQVEKLSTKSIILAGVECEVLRYKETVSHNAIVINCIIKSSNEERNKINEQVAENRYFEVIRPDICPNPVIMRFGLTFWSKHNDYIKRSITLVEKTYDEEGELPLLGESVMRDNMMLLLGEYIVYTKQLETILYEKGILADDDIDRLKKKSQTEITEVLREVFRVDNVENYE